VISTVVVICELVCPKVVVIYKVVNYLGCRSWTCFYLRWLFLFFIL